jgi:hypothetical protein
MKTIAGTDEAWEGRELGADAAYTEVAGAEHLTALNESLGMQSISIRIPKQMIEAYKLIAAFHGLGYQPLMRDILQRFIPEGMKEVIQHHEAKAVQATNRIEELKAEAEHCNEEKDDEYCEPLQKAA